MRILGLIPARSGSKGIPDKNICNLGGKPLMAYTIEQALACSVLTRVVVSTDSPRYREIAQRWGAEAPFLRPASLAEDHSTDREVFRHALNFFAEQNEPFDWLINLRPTAPFRSVEDIEHVIEKLRDTSLDSVRSVTRAEGVHHPYWMYRTDEQGVAHPFVDHIDPNQYLRRQTLPPVYRLNGVVDGIRTQVIQQHPFLYGDRMGTVEVPPRRAVDIDTWDDLDYANYLMNKINASSH